MWVSGIERFKGKLGLVFQGHDGQCQFGLPEELRGELPLASSGRLEATIEFSESTVVDTRDYLRAVGFGHLGSDGQRCYEFETAVGPMVVPSQFLVVALVGVTTLMRAPLLSPQGPTALMTAFGDEKISLELTPGRMRKFQIDRLAAVGRMSWILTHPSGTRAWSSVYFHAISGKLDVTLPSARSKVALRGIQSDGKLWVTSLEILTLEPMELPHEFVADARCSGSQWTFAKTRGLPKLEPTTRASNICARMTDEQWGIVQARLASHRKWMDRKQRAYCVRSRLDAIRLHLYSGVSFYQLSISPGLREASRGLFKRLKRMLILNEVLDALQSTT